MITARTLNTKPLRILLTGTLLLAALMIGAHPAKAANALYSGTGFHETSYSMTVGMELTPTADISVTSLGVFDGGVDGAGLQTDHDVGLWDDSGTLLASVTVTNSDTLTNDFRYAAISPVILTAGQKYYLGAYYPNLSGGDKDSASIKTDSPFVTIPNNAYVLVGSGLSYPDPALAYQTTPGNYPAFMLAANLQFNPVDTSPVDLTGTVKTSGGTNICAMVLANGKFMFSCNPTGTISLSGIPRATDGTVKLQIYAQGFRPSITTVVSSGSRDIVMTASGSCPNYNAGYSPAVTPGSAGMMVNISGQVLLQNSTTPVCAMVLANGQYMFSCGASLGSYSLNIPLDANGQYKLQVYAQGFAPYTIKLDEFQLVNDARLARAVECN